MNPKLVEPCWLVVRNDPDGSITVKIVVWTQDKANQEVDRLNKLNSDKGCYYQCFVSRALKRT